VLRVRIDAELCTGHGRCYTLAPEVFDSDESGYGVVVSEVVADEMLAKAVLGEQNCPERAISLVEG
jgi:ferredoxin